MAGAYADVPGHRMALDKDGSAMFWFDSDGFVTPFTPADIVKFNDESDATTWSNTGLWADNEYGYVMVMFPEKRDLRGAFLAATIGGNQDGVIIATSVNTTTGMNGDWLTRHSGYTVPTTTKPGCRSAIKTFTANGVQALRVRMSPTSGGVTLKALHVYGSITANYNKHRLAIWHPTSNSRVTASYFDWGNTPRNSSADKKFRIKNMSSLKTANVITIGMSALTDTTPSVPGQHLVSSDNGITFADTAVIPALAPGNISSPIILRRVTPIASVLGMWTSRLGATVETWS